MEKVIDNSGEKGFAMIPHQALFSGIGIYPYAVFCALMHYADKDGSCFPSIETIGKNLGVGKDTVIKAIKKLVYFKMIIIEPRKRNTGGLWKNNTYKILNKKLWITNQVDHSDMVSNSTSQSSPTLRQRPDQVDVADTNNTHIEQDLVLTKPINTANPSDSQEINQVIELFAPLNAFNLYKNKTQRLAAAALLKKFPAADLIELCRAVIAAQGQPYVPTVTTPWHMAKKIGDVLVYIERSKNTKKKIIIGYA